MSKFQKKSSFYYIIKIHPFDFQASRTRISSQEISPMYVLHGSTGFFFNLKKHVLENLPTYAYTYFLACGELYDGDQNQKLGGPKKWKNVKTIDGILELVKKEWQKSRTTMLKPVWKFVWTSPFLNSALINFIFFYRMQ